MAKPWPDHIEYPEIPAYEMLRESAKQYPEQAALSFMGKVITFRELDELTDKFATVLAELGVKKGNRVAIFMLNVPQYVIAYYGALKAGTTVVLCNPLYKEHELEFQLTDSGSNTIILLNLSDPSLYTIFNNIRTKTPVKNVIVTDIASVLPTAKRILGSLLGKIPKGPALKPGDHDFYDLIRKAEARPPEIAIDPKEDVAAIQYSGGTTGVPKGAMLTHFNLVTNCLQSEQLGIHSSIGARRGEEKFLTALPLYHSYGMTTCMNCAILMGGEIILIPNPRDIPSILKAIEKRKPTFFNGIPALYVAVANHPDAGKYDLSSLKFCISGSAPLPDAVCTAFEQATGAITNVCEGYGLTEASPVTHANPLNREIRKIGTIGFSLPDTECRIVDVETGTKEMPLGEPGELIIKGPQIMKGYWNNPTETAATLRDGWLLTGDITTVDEDGYYAIVDRKKDMIICSGFNVYPVEVEGILFKHPKIKEAAVIGIPDEKRGETVKAFIILKEGETATEEEIIQWAKEHMAAYKYPRIIEFRDELPKTTVGKVLRKELKVEEQQKRKDM